MDEQYTVLDRLTHVRHLMATRAAEGVAYKGWDDAYVRSKLRDSWKAGNPIVGTFTRADFASLTPEERGGILGNWDDKLRLIPLWLWPWIERGQEATTISGKTVTLTDETDVDHRGGWLAVGWVFD